MSAEAKLGELVLLDRLKLRVRMQDGCVALHGSVGDRYGSIGVYPIELERAYDPGMLLSNLVTMLCAVIEAELPGGMQDAVT